MEKFYNDNYYKAIDVRCRYWLLLYPKKLIVTDELSEAKYVEGVIRYKLEDKTTIIWNPINIADKNLFDSVIFNKDDFIDLIHDAAIIRITPEDIDASHVKIYPGCREHKEYFMKGLYFNIKIPTLIENRGGIVLETSCSNPDFYEKIKRSVNDSNT